MKEIGINIFYINVWQTCVCVTTYPPAAQLLKHSQEQAKNYQVEIELKRN